MSSRCPNDSSNALNTEFQDETQNPLRKLYIAIGLCTLFMAVELVGGYLANSLAIISDAVHLLSGKQIIIIQTKIIYIKMWPDFLQALWPSSFLEDQQLRITLSDSKEYRLWALWSQLPLFGSSPVI